MLAGRNSYKEPAGGMWGILNKPRGALPGQDIQLQYSIHHKMVQISMVWNSGGDWIKKRGERSAGDGYEFTE